MTKIYLTRRNIIAFSILHLAGTLGILFLLSVTFGCVQKKDLQDDFGPSYSAEQILDAKVSALGGKKLGDSNVNAEATYTQTLASYSSAPTIVGFYKLKLLGKKVVDELWELQVKKTSYDSSGAITSEPAETCWSEIEGVLHNCQFARFDTAYTNVNYHNLKTSKLTVNPPDSVRNSSNCGGLSPCKLNIQRVEYDLLFTDSDGKRQRYHETIDFAAETNYLGSIFKYCQEFLYYDKESAREIPVKVCDELIDFKNQ